jgi:hypothetical protein
MFGFLLMAHTGASRVGDVEVTTVTNGAVFFQSLLADIEIYPF